MLFNSSLKRDIKVFLSLNVMPIVSFIVFCYDNTVQGFVK